MSLLFLGSGALGLPILDRLAARRPGAIVVGTVPDAIRGRHGTPAPTPIKSRARELGLEYHEVATLAREHGRRLIDQAQAKLCIVADFRIFLTRGFLNAVPRHCYNLHPSMLPRYRGAAPVARAILAGERQHGVTLYRMVREMDAGPIVDQRPCPVPESLTRPELELRLAQACADLVEEWLPRLESGEVSLTEQDPARVTFAPPLTKAEGWIDWSFPAERIARQVLAMTPWPRTFSRWQARAAPDGVLVFFDRAHPVAPEHGSADPGTILGVGAQGVRVACGAGGTEAVAATVLQRAGGKPLPAADFLRGTRISIGDRFEGGESVA
ncbi:MAG: methionyl-tRNA formyltransferase [Planctomycetota bacterium]